MEQTKSKISFKSKAQLIGGSRYILVPAKTLEYENVSEETIYDVTLEF